MDSTHCKHGVNPSWCALCAPKKENLAKLRKPQPRVGSTIHGSGAPLTTRILDAGYLVVDAKDIRRIRKEDWTDERVGFVHISGHPYLWLVEWLLARFPTMHTIQITPKHERDFGPKHRLACNPRRIRIVTGFDMPANARDTGFASPHYNAQRAFLLALQGEQKELLNELLRLGFLWAELTARYFCLKGEPFKNQLQVAEQMDYHVKQQHRISASINAVLHYLDPTFSVGGHAKRKAEAMRRRVERLRGILTVSSSREEIARRLGLEHLPEGMPLSRLNQFEGVMEATRSTTFQAFRNRHPQTYRILALRYGLEDHHYRTLKEIAQLMGVHYDTVRYHEEKAFHILGIETD